MEDFSVLKELRENFQLILKGYVETLQFYANPDNYKTNPDNVMDCHVIDADGGQRARDILKERL